MIKNFFDCLHIWFFNDFRYGELSEMYSASNYKSIGAEIIPRIYLYYYHDDNEGICFYITISFLFWALHIDYEGEVK